MTRRLIPTALALLLLLVACGSREPAALTPTETASLVGAYLAPYHPANITVSRLTRDSASHSYVASVSVTVPAGPGPAITLKDQLVYCSYDLAGHRFYVDELRTPLRGAIDNMLATRRAIDDARSGAHKLSPTTWSK